jgi:trafficking protein particle complex subunit 1
MAVHSLHIFDRKGRTLFTKRYAPKSNTENVDADQLSEQRKLVFGMLFSLREVATSLSPAVTDGGTRSGGNGGGGGGGLYSVKTGASTLFCHETTSGLRFALFVTNTRNTSESNMDANAIVQTGVSIRTALAHIYNELWIQCVIRSPLYRPTVSHCFLVFVGRQPITTHLLLFSNSAVRILMSRIQTLSKSLMHSWHRNHGLNND